MEVTKLKGGSLSGTYLYQEKNASFIRKKVSLNENREFGFYRWFSQLKKLQSLGREFPNLFPRVTNIGTEENTAFYDMEYIANALTGFEFLTSNRPQTEVDIFFQKLITAMESIHSIKIPSFKGGLDLYLDQEVRQAIELCKSEPFFSSFLEYKTIFFNGKETKPLLANLDKFYLLANKYYTKPEECLTHGNITLENILYIPESQRIVFIDLYQENYVDTIYNEYSQILQSSNSYYEVYNSNSAQAEIQENKVQIHADRIPNLDYFNTLFNNYLNSKLSPEEYKLTKLYEVTQFTRLLPFKKVVAKDKMIFFYALASNLLETISE